MNTTNTTYIVEHGKHSRTVPKADMSARYKNKAGESLMQERNDTQPAALEKHAAALTLRAFFRRRQQFLAAGILHRRCRRSHPGPLREHTGPTGDVLRGRRDLRVFAVGICRNGNCVDGDVFRGCAGSVGVRSGSDDVIRTRAVFVGLR